MEMDVKNKNQNICRTCLHYHSVQKSIFDLQFYSGNNDNVIEFIHRLTDLKFERGDGFPEFLCTLCIEKVNEAYNFSVLCKNSHSKLIQDWEKKIVLSRYEGTIGFDVKQQQKQTNKLFNKIKDNCEANDTKQELTSASLKQDETLEIIHESVSQNKTNHDTKDEAVVISTRSFHCKMCNKQFRNEKKLTLHLKSHENVQVFECDQCNRSFSKKTHLKIHLRSHIKSEEKQYVCEECGKSFSYMYLLKQHSFKHTETKPFTCVHCNKGCITKESLRRHMRIHDGNYTKKVYICEICRKEFPYPSFLAEHMKNHTGERPFLCSICGKGFRQKGALKYHMRSHTGCRPYTCQICNSSFMSRGILRVHMRKHTNERPYVCDICGMAFRQSTDMKSHRRIHTGDKPVLCTVCGKRMSTTGQLTVHLRSHTGEKPYSCETCFKAFSTKTMLVKHERIHTGERPYICNICGRAFNQSSTLKTHSNTHKVHKVKPNKSRTVGKVVMVNNSLVVDIGSPIIGEHVVNGIQVSGSEVKEEHIGRNQSYTVLPAPVPLLQNL